MSVTFPPTEVLGRTINCLKNNVDPFDPESVLQSNSSSTLVKFEPSEPWSFPNSGQIFAKPKNIAATAINAGAATSVFAEAGQDITKSIEADFKISAKYMAVTAKAGAGFAYESTFHKDMQYGFMNNASDLYAATLSGSERDILTDLKAQFWADLYALPTYYDKNDVQNQAEFKAFTNVYGTHLITNVTYGTRLELIISCSAGNSEINANFKANIEAEYKGVIGSGSGSADIKGSGEYKQYEKDRNTSIVVRGGDPSKRAVLQQSLQQNKVDEKAAIDWASSGRGIGNEALVHMDTVSLGELVANSDNEFERQVGQALNDYTMHVMYGNEIQSVPTTLNSKYGPCFVAWSPLGGGGTITITLKGDPLAQFTDFYPSKGEPILSEDRRTIQCTFTSGIQGRLVAIALFGVECGSHGTDVEITSSSSDTWATLQMNLSPSGNKNGASPYNYSLIYHYSQSGSKLFVPRAQLASRGQSESVIRDIFRVGDYGF